MQATRQPGIHNRYTFHQWKLLVSQIHGSCKVSFARRMTVYMCGSAGRKCVWSGKTHYSPGGLQRGRTPFLQSVLLHKAPACVRACGTLCSAVLCYVALHVLCCVRLCACACAYPAIACYRFTRGHSDSLARSQSKLALTWPTGRSHPSLSSAHHRQSSQACCSMSFPGSKLSS